MRVPEVSETACGMTVRPSRGRTGGAEPPRPRYRARRRDSVSTAPRPVVVACGCSAGAVTGPPGLPVPGVPARLPGGAAPRGVRRAVVHHRPAGAARANAGGDVVWTACRRATRPGRDGRRTRWYLGRRPLAPALRHADGRVGPGRRARPPARRRPAVGDAARPGGRLPERRHPAPGGGLTLGRRGGHLGGGTVLHRPGCPGAAGLGRDDVATATPHPVAVQHAAATTPEHPVPDDIRGCKNDSSPDDCSDSEYPCRPPVGPRWRRGLPALSGGGDRGNRRTHLPPRGEEGADLSGLPATAGRGGGVPPACRFWGRPRCPADPSCCGGPQSRGAAHAPCIAASTCDGTPTPPQTMTPVRGVPL
jgi:hypothetical protein